MAAEPVTLAEVKTHLRLGSSDREDVYLTTMISAARRLIENETGRDILATWSGLDMRDRTVVAQASLLLIGYWYANREAAGAIPQAVAALIRPLRKMVA